MRCFVVLHGLETSCAGSFSSIEDLRVRISTTFRTFQPGWQGASVSMDISRTFPFLDWNPGYCLFSTPRDHFCSLYTVLARQPVSYLFTKTKTKKNSGLVPGNYMPRIQGMISIAQGGLFIEAAWSTPISLWMDSPIEICTNLNVQYKLPVQENLTGWLAMSFRHFEIADGSIIPDSKVSYGLCTCS